MDTGTFLGTVLPDGGRRCIGVLQNKAFQNFFGADNQWAATIASNVDQRGVDTYFACSTYGAVNKRTQTEVAYVRSFWVDIDTQESKPRETYANRKVALQELLRFCSELDLDAPLVVSSGYGLHAYWPTDADMDAATWKQTALLLKEACKVWGLAADPSRTSDEASVLRPIGTHNHKYGKSKEVKVILPGVITTRAEFQASLAHYLGTTVSNAHITGTKPANAPVSLNSDLIGTPDFPPASGHKIAENCGVIALMRDTRGNIDQPTWYAALGVIHHTIEGDALCHEWSDGHRDYTPIETDTKIAQASAYGPTSCAKLGDCHPHICRACPHLNKIKSPIMLGHVVPEVVRPAPAVAAGAVPNAGEPVLPGGFMAMPDPHTGLRVVCRPDVVETVDENGAKVEQTNWKPISDTLFYPTDRLVQPDGTYAMTILINNLKAGNKTFQLEHGKVAEGGKSLAMELGKREIGIQATDRHHVDRYLVSWIGKLREEYAQIPTVTQFGWHDEGFIVGEKLLSAKGEFRAVTAKSVARMSKFLHAKGDPSVWVDNVDLAYNKPGAEALQFCVLGGFAAPLWQLFGHKGGVTVYAHSAGSGYGKSTAQMVGLSAWGYYPEMILRESGYTPNSLYNHFGLMNHLPVVVDEMTNCTTAFASEMVYNASAGTGKRRMTADGGERDVLNWSTIVMANGNNLLSEKLSLHRANAEAELSRIFEFTLDKRSDMPTHIADPLFAAFTENYGHSGQAFANYVVRNQDAVKASLYAKRESFNRKGVITQSERYWAALCACVLTALDICRELHLLQFDVQALEQWTLQQINANRKQIVTTVSEPLEQFADFMAEISAGILVTYGEGAPNAYAPIRKDPQGAIMARYIHDDGKSMSKLMVNTAVAKEWCNRKGVSFREIHHALVSHNIATREIVPYALGRGTEKYAGILGNVKCWAINPGAASFVFKDTPAAEKIIQVITNPKLVTGR